MGFISSCGIYFLLCMTMGRGGAGMGFVCLKDFLTYTTTGPRGDGVGFYHVTDLKLLRREDVGRGVSFVEWGEGTIVIGLRRNGGYFFKGGQARGQYPWTRLVSFS